MFEPRLRNFSTAMKKNTIRRYHLLTTKMLDKEKHNKTLENACSTDPKL